MSLNTPSNIVGPVLIVDASNEALSRLEETFHAHQIETDTASDTRTALVLYGKLRKAHRHPQIAIIDSTISTGSTSGFDLAKSIHNIDKGKYTTTFIYTANEPFLAAMLALDAHVETVISKSIVGPALIDEIEKALAKKIRRETRAKEAGQLGGSWFSNKEMGTIAINVLILIIIVWFVGRMDYQLTVLTSKQGLQELKMTDIREKLAAKGLLNTIKESDNERSTTSPVR